MKKEQFDSWFIEQFGAKPMRKKSDKALRFDVDVARHRLVMAEAAQRRREDWNRTYTAALYGWNARPKP